MRNVSSSRVAGFALSLLAVSALCDTALASGPVERLIQVLNDPSDPKHVVVRYGLASEGFLISRDGGTTFKAMCSQAITPTEPEGKKLKRLSGQRVPSTAATLIDHTGKLLVGQLDGLWSDDGTGCTWSKVAALDGKWVYSLARDPSNANELLAVVNETTGTDPAQETHASLWRRTADGAWTSQGQLVKSVPMLHAYGSELIGVKAGTGTRLYAAVNVSVGVLGMAKENLQVVTSEDGGKTWTDASAISDAQKEGFTLLAADPLEPKRVLAVQYRDGANDTLLLSEDAGKTFKTYSDVGETRAVTFAPDGRVFVGDAGADGGGIWTATRLGQPLTLINGSTAVDCLAYKAADSRLQACVGPRFGSIDPATGVFDQAVEMRDIESLIDCPGADMFAVCQTQLNAGASWCCGGHYPYTPFCGEYDVTMFAGRRLYCGLSGRALDCENGLGPAGCKDAGAGTVPTSPSDAGKPPASDAGATGGGSGPTLVDAAPRKPDAGNTGSTPATTSKSDDGCACAVPTTAAGFGAGLSWTLAGLALLVVRSRRRPLFARSPEGALRRDRGLLRRPS